MKKIFRYIILLIVVYVVVETFVYFLTKTYYQDMNNYEIIQNIPVVIEVTESKVAKNKGYIEGVVTNNNEIINNLSIKFDFYNTQGILVGTKLEKIGIINVTEKVKFDVKYEYKDVAKIEISIVSQ